jgi:hypothetical protein
LANNCCQCAPASVAPVCRVTVTSADLGDLIYVSGLDAGLCPKLETPHDVVCGVLSALPAAGAAEFGSTQLVGADCQLYTVTEVQVVITVTDTPCIDLTVTGGNNVYNLQADLVISPAADNAAVCQQDGLYVPTACAQFAGYADGGQATTQTELVGKDCLTYQLIPQEPLLVQDTNTVDLTINPAVPQTLSADVKISAFPGNEIVALVDGIYAPDVDVVGLDTPCFDITVTESPADTFTISGSPVISPNAGNALSCQGNGLYVPQSQDVNVLVQDGDCLDLSVVEAPAGTFTISGDVEISSTAGNQIQCTIDGLYVPTGAGAADVSMVAIDTACLNLDVTEAPANNFTITGSVPISPNPGNALSCVGNGLFADFTNISALDTNCINTTVTEGPDGTFVISSAPILANTYPGHPADCNGLLCTALGLSAPPDSDGDSDFTPLGASQINGPTLQGDVVASPVVSLFLANPSACRDAVVTIFYTQGRVLMGTQTGNGASKAQAISQVNANLPGFVVAFLTNFMQDETTNTQAGLIGDDIQDMSNQSHEHTFVVPPAWVGTVTLQTIFTQVTGGNDFVVFEGPVLFYNVITI